MNPQRFFVPSPLAVGVLHHLNDDQSRQVRLTLRLRPGDDIVVFDGSGAEGSATITDMTRHGVAYEVRSVAKPEREPRIKLRVALALLRGERFDLAVQKLTELGVSRITPLTAERCVVSFPVAADWDRRLTRLRRVAQEAAEQSERLTVPEIDAPIALAELLRQAPACCLVERSNATPLANVSLDRATTLVIGPEGGWSPKELNAIVGADATIAHMGRLILRAETAAIVASGTIVQRAWAEQNELD